MKGSFPGEESLADALIAPLKNKHRRGRHHHLCHRHCHHHCYMFVCKHVCMHMCICDSIAVTSAIRDRAYFEFLK